MQKTNYALIVYTLLSLINQNPSVQETYALERNSKGRKLIALARPTNQLRCAGDLAFMRNEHERIRPSSEYHRT